MAVRTPSNYRPQVAHPLLVVFAAAGHSARQTERFTGLTPMATAAGMVVAYIGPVRMDVERIKGLADIPSILQRDWCLDERRVYFTGHSNGGTVAQALAVLPGIMHRAAAIAPSAAGMRGADLAVYRCPQPLSVMVLHNRGDRLFPGFGTESAQWWAACNRCDASARPVPARPDCVEYSGCADATKVWHCDGEGGHLSWHGLEMGVVEFLADSATAPSRAADGARSQ